eukprot:44641-Rhodomonas_salina.2
MKLMTQRGSRCEASLNFTMIRVRQNDRRVRKVDSHHAEGQGLEYVWHVGMQAFEAQVKMDPKRWVRTPAVCTCQRARSAMSGADTPCSATRCA